MAKTVMYNLYSSAAYGGAASASTVSIVRPGKIIAFSIQVSGTGGAGIGFLKAGVGLNYPVGVGNGPMGINNPQREVGIGTCAATSPNAGGFASTNSVSGISIPVATGDNLVLGTRLESGTSPASGTVDANIYVHED